MAAGLAVTLAMTAWSGAWAQSPAVGDHAPRVSVKDLDGAAVDLGAFYGSKPVVILFWATWCPVCERLMPQLDSARARFGDRVELLGINVTVNESQSRVRRYIQEHAPPFTTLWDDEGESIRAFDVLGTSMVVVIDTAGRLAYSGYGVEQDILREIHKVLSGPP